MPETEPDRGASPDRQPPDPQGLADELEQKADDMEQASHRLERETKEVAQDWERKRADDSVPGAPPRSEDEEGEPPTGAPSGKGDDGAGTDEDDDGAGPDEGDQGD